MPPPVAEFPASSDESETAPKPALLAYSARIPAERSLFRFMVWLGLIQALVSIARLTADVVQIGFSYPPQWTIELSRLADRRIFEWYFIQWIWKRIWQAALIPLIDPLLCLFLLAGAIGYLRHNPRARWWLITYCCLQMIVIAVTLTIGFIERDSYMRAMYVNPPSVVFGLVSTALAQAAFPLILLWLATRPYADLLYQRSR